MQHTNLFVTAPVVVLLWTFACLSACSSGTPPEADDQRIDCQVDEDCPGEGSTCNLLTRTCSKTSDDSGEDCRDAAECSRDEPDGGMPEDAGESQPDVDVQKDVLEPQDSGPVEDSTVEEDVSEPDGSRADVDSGEPADTATDAGDGTDADESLDTGVDTGTDTGAPNFSGCTSDSECSGYLICDTAAGRCHDPRTACSDASDCSGGETCMFGRCSAPCGGGSSCDRAGLSCETITFSGGSSEDYCIAVCDTFGLSGQTNCGEDTQCLPLFGDTDGVCRGVGTNQLGQTCETDYGERACQAGSYCMNNSGDKRCRSLCSSSGTPGCAAGEYCHESFVYDQQYNEVDNPTGICLTDCGGHGASDDSLCSPGRVCQPISNDHGYCTTPDSAD